MDRFVIISGCSGGGKSTVLGELRKRGYSTVEEPGRRIVVEELAASGVALSWADATAFVRRIVTTAVEDWVGATTLDGWIFFDRGLIDGLSGLQHLTGEPVLATLGQTYRYHRRVFMAPPWPEIYRTDAERRHTLQEAVIDYERTLPDYLALGYELVTLPKAAPAERVDFILHTLTDHARDFFQR